MSTDDAAPTRSLWAGGSAMTSYLRTESGSSVVLLAAALLGLVWANVATASYEEFWETTLSIGFGDHVLALPLREWVNSGLMAFFFFVVGLETRRELDLGEFRERRNLLLPVAAGVAGMVAAGLLYLLVTRGTPGGRRLGHPALDRHRVRPRGARVRRARQPSAACARSCSTWWSPTTSRSCS